MVLAVILGTSDREGEESATSPEKAESGDTVTLFEGRNTCVWGVRGKKMKTTSSRGVCPTRTAGVVDVVYVNIVTWFVWCESMGELAKGGAVVSRPGKWVMDIRATSKEASSPSK